MMDKIKSTLFGLAVGDALGVPVEFTSRESLKRDPVVDMREYGSHHQPKGTWSDDSSIAFCLAESLIDGYDLTDMASKFVHWKQKSYWTPHGAVFDIGITTRCAIDNLAYTLRSGKLDNLKFLKYLGSEDSNGNGSLMRIAPLYFYLKSVSEDKWFDLIWDCSALTHGHIRSAIACHIYLIFMRELSQEKDKTKAYRSMQLKDQSFFDSREIAEREQSIFARLIRSNISDLEEDGISSSGYVVSSLMASIWCFLKYDNYKEVTLAAVNLGEDTDTTGAIAGALAGYYYGYDAIPEEWVDVLVRKEDIIELCNRMNKSKDLCPTEI